MFWALASSVLVIYLYRKQNAEAARVPGEDAVDTVESELEALNAQIDALESKIVKTSLTEIKP